MTTDYPSAAPDERATELARVRAVHAEQVRRGLSLDMTRGKPCPEQLDLANGLLTCISVADVREAMGDIRNYGGIDGIPEAKALFGDYMGVGSEEVIVGGNSSLALMHDSIVNAWLRPVPGAPAAWGKLPNIAFLCPSPGYDRHFAICESLGIEMIPVAIGADGPDMDEVEALVAERSDIKGIWCVPRYSNPTGIVYSDDTVTRLATMKTAAPDFRVFWDNAYAVHHLTEQVRPLRNLLRACEQAGTADRALMFGSTSKISFAGAGVSVMASSPANLSYQKKAMSVQTIGPDKVNQLRHVRFFGDLDGIHTHMRRHAEIILPKFAAVSSAFESLLDAARVATLSRPEGGYFFSLDSVPGTAQRIVDLAAEAGVKLTPAGATFPYGKDPNDQNIRLAPTLPGKAEIAEAMEVICNSVRYACLETLK